MNPVNTILLELLGALIGLFALSGQAAAKKANPPLLTSVRTPANLVLDTKAEGAWSKAATTEVTLD